MDRNIFIKKVRACVKKYSMITHGDCVLVAVSGGADSISLLYALHALKDEIGFSIATAHFNHRLRGKDAAKDAEFVQGEARKLGVQCVIKETDVKKYSKKMKLSLQEAGREVRYSFFFEEAEKVSANKIALGHTLDDQAETVLMRLLRGSGVRGLAGIPPVRDKKIIRPLIEISRKEIEGFLLHRCIKWVEDISNVESHYLRTKVRHRLLPVLKKEYNPNIVHTLNRLGKIFTEEEAFLADYCENLFRGISTETEEGLQIDARKIEEEKYIAVRRRVIRRCIEFVKGDTRRVSFDHVEHILAMSKKGVSGKYLVLPGNFFVMYENEQLFFRSRAPGKKCVEKFDYILHIPDTITIKQIKFEFTTEVCNSNQIDHISHDRYTAFLDLQKTGNILKVRQRLPGDKFFPLGMKGEKKVKDFLIDEKVPRNQRDAVPLVLSEDNRIIWVAGMRISENAKIDKTTGEVLKITAHKF